MPPPPPTPSPRLPLPPLDAGREGGGLPGRRKRSNKKKKEIKKKILASSTLVGIETDVRDSIYSSYRNKHAGFWRCNDTQFAIVNSVSCHPATSSACRNGTTARHSSGDITLQWKCYQLLGYVLVINKYLYWMTCCTWCLVCATGKINMGSGIAKAS